MSVVYRVLLLLTLLLWLAATVLLAEIAQPLVAFRFSSMLALLWAVAGVGLFVLLLLTVARRRSARAWLAEQYDMVSAYLNEPILICTPKGKIRWRNDAARDVLTLPNQLPASALTLLNRARSTRGVAIQTLAFGEGQRYSVQAIPLNRRSVALVCRPLQTDSSKNTFYENFIRRIVHDMRNPLAAIIGHASNMQQSPQVDDVSWRKSAGTIEHEAQRLARLVDSMLFDARLAYVPLDPRPLDLVEVLEEAIYIHDEQAEREGKSIELETPPGTIRIDGDRDLLVRAFGNLVDNSLKYSGEKGWLGVRVVEEPGDYVISFADNGYGIPPDYLPDRIFEPLTRARANESGSGLGLSIARKIFEMHNGTITAESKLGQGTTMTVRLTKPR